MIGTVIRIMSPYSTFRFARPVNISVSACSSQELVPAADADQLKVIVSCQLFLCLADGQDVFGMRRDIHAELPVRGLRGINGFLCLVSALKPCIITAVQAFYILHPCP